MARHKMTNSNSNNNRNKDSDTKQDKIEQESSNTSRTTSNGTIMSKSSENNTPDNSTNIIDDTTTCLFQEPCPLQNDSHPSQVSSSNNSTANLRNANLKTLEISHKNNLSSSSLSTSESHQNSSSGSTASTVIRLYRSMMKIISRARQYLSSLRPGTFFTSLIPVLMGTVLACKTSGGHFSWVILLATLLTVLSIHAAGNLVNTYCDFVRGIDSKRQSDDRTLVDSILTPEEVVNLGVLFYIIGCIGFLIVVLQSPARMELLAFIYFGGLSSSFLYTGGIGLKYIALGDIIIMITFGPVSVLYSFIAQTGTIRLVTLLYAIPLALNTEAILHSNNTRDIDVDRRAGCVTIAMLIGYGASHVLFALLLFVPYILFIVVAINYSFYFIFPLITLPKAFELEKQFRYRCLQQIPQQMAKLNFYFGMFYLFACFMSPAHKLPGLLPVLGDYP